MNPVETERLLLRRIEGDDAAFFYELLNDPGFIKNIGNKEIKNVVDASKYISNVATKSYEEFGFGMYVVELKNDQGITNTPLGISGLVKRAGLDDVDLGLAFLMRHCSQGYAFESASAVLIQAQKEFHIKRLAAITGLENLPSIRLLEKLGFQFERLVTLPGVTGDRKLFGRNLIG